MYKFSRKFDLYIRVVLTSSVSKPTESYFKVVRILSHLTSENRSSRAFSLACRRLHIFALDSDWSIALFRSVVIGQSNYIGFEIATLLKTANP